MFVPSCSEYDACIEDGTYRHFLLYMCYMMKSIHTEYKEARSTVRLKFCSYTIVDWDGRFFGGGVVSVLDRCGPRLRDTKGGGTLGGKDDGVLTTTMVGCGRPSDSVGVDLRIVDTEVTQPFSPNSFYHGDK